MSDTIISVENLCKKYLLSHLAEKREQLFSRLLVNKAKNAASRTLDFFRSSGIGGSTQTVEEFWALKDVSFEIRHGDRVGIIGRNGAGKSTLLKILSRITEPTKGRITIEGRVASLLEVGTGFHSELSGRENIYLNGAILGMSREEIKRKFDEIVAFAEVEKFLDTPVKRYSSGMYVRLAFAVAAHLEPEILIVDEVLAVGDAQFQKKCLGKMEDVGKEGRTVLFVSHQMNYIAALCNKAILLSNGSLNSYGNATDTINNYLNIPINMSKNLQINSIRRMSADYGIKVRIADLRLSDTEYKILWKDLITIDVRLDINDVNLEDLDFGMGINDLSGMRIFTYENEKPLLIRHRKSIKINLAILSPRLMPGVYSVAFGVRSRNVTLDYIANALEFEVDIIDKFGKVKGFTHGGQAAGYIDPDVSIREIE
jgi:lipopolysaccharide transport system ATP-binding protein